MSDQRDNPQGLVSIKQSYNTAENDLFPVMENAETGARFLIDLTAARHQRLCRRVRGWTAALQPWLNSHRYRLVMVTLTYRPTADGQTAWRKNHVRDFMHKVKRKLAGNLLAYAWVAELQARGEMHYHVLLLVRRGTAIPHPDKAGWWSHGSTRIETARHVFYLLKYTQKKRFRTADGWSYYPPGAHWFAVWLSDDVVSEMERLRFRWTALPRWLNTLLTGRDQPAIARRAPGGGWFISFDEGPPEYEKSPYRLVTLYGDESWLL